MRAFICLISLGLIVHLVSGDVSHIYDSNQQNVNSAPVKANYNQSPQASTKANYNQNPQGYDYSGSYSTVAPENKAQYVSTPSSKNGYEPYPSANYNQSPQTPTKANYNQSPQGYDYSGSYSTVAPDNKAQYVSTPRNSYVPYASANYNQSPQSPTKANYNQSPQGYDYSGSYSTVAPENKAQYVSTPSSKNSYQPYPSGQVSSEQKYSSARQEYNPQYQNDRGVTLISKELQVPFISSNSKDNSDGCEDTKVSNVNQHVQAEQTGQIEQTEQTDEVEETEETYKPVVKTSNYEVRRPGIRKEFYDIEEKVFIKPAGSAVFELQHDKPHSSAIINRHFYQPQSHPSQFTDDGSQYYPQQQDFDYSHANHGYNPIFIQPAPSVPSTGYDYNHIPQPPQRPQYVPQYPNTYNPVPPTAITPQYVPSVTGGYLPPSPGGYLPPCEDVPNPSSTPQPPSHEFSGEPDDEHDYDSDAAFIDPQKEDNKEYVDVVYSPSKSNSNRDREDYRVPQSPVYNDQTRVDRVRNEYKNQRGDLAQQKVSQYPGQFHQEYVPTVNVNQKQVQIRPNGAPLAKYTQEKGVSEAEIENAQRLLDLYSANGDVTEISGRSKSQNYEAPNTNVRARVVSVTPAPKYADYVDEQTKSRRVVLSKPLYTVQQVEVREHPHRLVEDIQTDDSVEPKVSEFQKLRIIGASSGKSSYQGRADVNKEVEYVTPVPQAFGQLRAGTPVPENLQK